MHRFYTRLSSWAETEGWLRLAFLTLDGRPIAGDLALESAGVHYVLAADYDDAARLSRLEHGLLPQPPSTWFNLTNTFEDRGNIIASQTIDRLFVGYATPDFVLRLGRQALTWGGARFAWTIVSTALRRTP